LNLLSSEWLKLWTARTTWAMLGIGLLGEALFAGLFSALAPLDGLDQLHDVATGTGLLMVLVLILGVLIVTNEFRHGTASSTFLVTPKRYPALLGKVGVALLAGIVAGLAFVVVNAGLSVPLLSGRGATMPSTGDLTKVYAGVVVSFALLCVFGLGVGAVIRNQVGAIIGAIAFFFVISPLPELLPGSIGDYFPAQALGALHGHAEGNGALGQVTGGLVLAGWAAALTALGIAIVMRRDVGE
jgi:hypothetical protein